MSQRGLFKVILSDLPEAAVRTLALIGLKETYSSPFRKDGAIFRNSEGRLPARPRGYYREYTVPTPGSTKRGSRRFVVGEAGEIYYTEDHYQTFVEVATS